MNLGDLLDGAVRLFVANWRALLLAVGVVFVPIQLLIAWLQRGLFQVGLLQLLTDPTALDAVPDPTAPFGVVGLRAVVLSTVVSVLLLPVLAGAVCKIVAGSFVGRPVPWGAALQAASGRFFSLVGASILVHLVEALPFLPALVVFIAAGVTRNVGLLALGALLVLGGVVGVVVLSALYTAAAPAVVTENVGAVAAMRRSWRLRSPRLWPTVGAALVAGLLAGVVGYIVSVIPTTIGAGIGGDYAWVLLGVGGVLGQLVQVPFIAIVATLLYFDGRIRQEGFDLQMMAADLGQ